MSRHVLFVVHGMGVTDPVGWADSAMAKLMEVAKRYEQKHFPMAYFENNVIVVPINYSDILTAKVAEWQTDAAGVDAFARTNKVEDHGVLRWLEASDDVQRKFLWSHISHVILYRFFPLIRERIRVSVIRQIMEGIEREFVGQTECRCSVLAHSLGTSVAHDCLHILGSNPTWKDPETEKVWRNAFKPDDFRFSGIFMVANVSRLLQTDIKAYESIVRPGPSLDRSSYCASYYDVRHTLDPIPMPFPFEPDGWQPGPDVIAVQHIRDWNIHSLEHYLDNPGVHIPLLRKLAGTRSIGHRDEHEAVQAYSQFAVEAIGDENVQKIVTKLLDVVRIAKSSQAPAEYLSAFAQFLSLVDDLREVLE